MTEPLSLSAAERAALLGVARAAIRHHLGAGPAPELPASGALGERRGAFVTIRRRGELRGCIGRLQPDEPLAQLVAEVAVSAADADPRFEPLRPDELDEIDLSISVLEPARPFSSPGDIRLGKDGLLVRLGWNRGVLLPVVAVEHGWDATTFLRQACLKAGLWPEAWEDSRAVVELFEAQEFGDGE